MIRIPGSGSRSVFRIRNFRKSADSDPTIHPDPQHCWELLHYFNSVTENQMTLAILNFLLELMIEQFQKLRFSVAGQSTNIISWQLQESRCYEYIQTQKGLFFRQIGLLDYFQCFTRPKVNFDGHYRSAHIIKSIYTRHQGRKNESEEGLEKRKRKSACEI